MARTHRERERKRKRGRARGKIVAVTGTGGPREKSIKRTGENKKSKDEGERRCRTHISQLEMAIRINQIASSLLPCH